MVSIIIPVYNAEEYLDRCLGSVLAQDFTSYEVILVDDWICRGDRKKSQL